MARLRRGREQVSSKTKKEVVRYKRIRYQDIDEMTPYEKWRVFMAVLQVFATLTVPFIIVWINEYLKAN